MRPRLKVFFLLIIFLLTALIFIFVLIPGDPYQDYINYQIKNGNYCNLGFCLKLNFDNMFFSLASKNNYAEGILAEHIGGEYKLLFNQPLWFTDQEYIIIYATAGLGNEATKIMMVTDIISYTGIELYLKTNER